MRKPTNLELKGITLLMSIVALYVIGLKPENEFGIRYLASMPIYFIALFTA
jgi:hypothetical protein